LEEQGLVNVNKPIETYISELASSEWAGTPIIDILDMASGMEGLEADDPEAYTNPESPYGLFEASLGYQPSTPNTMKSTYEYIATLKRQKESGKRDEYTSVNTFVLSWLVEKLLDKPYAEIVSETFWQKIGAETDAMIGVSPVGAPGSSGLVSSTLRDLARYGLLYTPSWNKISEEKVIPDSLIKRIQEEGRPALFNAGLAKETWGEYMGEDAIFGTRQFDFVTKDGDFAKTGYHGQTLYISPSKDLVVASFATGELYDTYRFARVIATA
jgi:CubicO group peptidase (beta-lactamase class C family)